MRKMLCAVALVALAACGGPTEEDMLALQEANDELTSDNESLQEALDQANANIEDAQGYADTSYEEMQSALETIETVEP